MADPRRRAGAAWRCQSGLLHSASFWLVISCPAGHLRAAHCRMRWNRADAITDPVLVDDWHPVVAATHRAGSSARLLGEDMSSGRPTDGRRLAGPVVHRGTRLSLGRVDGCTLQCPYHGWVYGADGQCVRIPALPDAPHRARPRQDLSRPSSAMAWSGSASATRRTMCRPFPEWHDGGFRKLLGLHVVDASGPGIVENFLDVAHFPFVHENILGTPERPEIADYEAVINDQAWRRPGSASISRTLRHRPGDQRSIPIQPCGSLRCSASD